MDKDSGVDDYWTIHIAVDHSTPTHKMLSLATNGSL